MKKKIIIVLAILILLFSTFYYSTYALSKYGSVSDEVRTIQTKLKRWGYYNGEVDGIFGSLTLKAVKYFQTKNRIKS